MQFNGLMERFLEIFHKNPKRIFFAPGRINLIGEHVDYNDGLVFPCAISIGTYALARKRDDNIIKMYSINFNNDGVMLSNLSKEAILYKVEDGWTNYPKGMLKYIIGEGYSIPCGMDILYYSNMPIGSGLSSSASIEMVSGLMFSELFNLDIDILKLIKMGKRVENEFIGVNSGIMDQFAIGMGKKGYGMHLNCKTLDYSYVPIDMDNHKMVIMNTNKRRELKDSKYNDRRRECEEALSKLKEVLPVKSLGELNKEVFENNKNIINSEILVKRAKHVVHECNRTHRAVEELRNGNLKEFGRLMNESHLSLKNDYDVTGLELDTLVESAWEQEGVVGARMTGAGFGGCALAIVENNKVQEFIKNVGQKYIDVIGYRADFYVANVDDGVREIKF